MDRDQQDQVALHRWAVIAEAANARLRPAERGVAVRAAAARTRTHTHTHPDGTTRRYSRGTIDRWVRAWRAGVDACRTGIVLPGGPHACGSPIAVPVRPSPGAPPDRSLQAMQIHSARPSSVRGADPVADLAREFHCPGVAGHPAHPEQFQGWHGGLVRGGHRRALRAPGQEDLPRRLRGGGRDRAHRSCASRRSSCIGACTRSWWAITWPPLWVTRGGLPNCDLRPGGRAGQMLRRQRIDRHRIGCVSTRLANQGVGLPDSTARSPRQRDVGTCRGRRKGGPAIWPGRVAHAHRLRNRINSTTEGYKQGRAAMQRSRWWRLHVQRNARMHLRSAAGSDTMALRRRRIVISRRGSSRYPGSAVLDIPRLERP